jgi:hypothetical protein
MSVELAASGRLAREFRGVGLAQDHGAGGAEQADDRSIKPGLVTGVGARAVGGGHVRSLGDVLDRHGDAVQRPTLVRRYTIGRLRVGDHRRAIEVDDGVQLRVCLLDAVDTGGDEGFDGEITRGQQAAQVTDGGVGETVAVGHGKFARLHGNDIHYAGNQIPAVRAEGRHHGE